MWSVWRSRSIQMDLACARPGASEYVSAIDRVFHRIGTDPYVNMVESEIDLRYHYGSGRERKKGKQFTRIQQRRNTMGKPERIEALRSKHQNIEELIEDEERHAVPDEVVIHALKKQKLRIKDELLSMGAVR